MTLEKTIPIEWKEWDLVDTLVLTFYGVTFVEGFGVFEKGSTCRFLTVDYSNGIVREIDEEGRTVREQKYKAQFI